MGRRTLLLIAALVVAALGTLLVWMYAQNADSNAQKGQTLKSVLVAKTKIEVGTSGAAAAADGAFEQVSVPESALAENSLSDASPIADQVAIVPVFPGQQIISPQWGTSGSTSGLSIPKGQIALSVQLGDPERVAGFVSPGSTVAIFTTGTTGAGAVGSASVRLLLDKIEVLAVGPTTLVSAASSAGSANTEAIPSAILTLSVTQDQAQKIIYASGKTGGATYTGLYFALMNADSEVTVTNPGANSTNLFR
jgi:pilus assembly protein CpaB